MSWRILCFALVAGCGAPGPATLGDFYDQYSAETCRSEVRCGLIGASEVAACTTSYRALFAKYLIAAFGYEEAIAARRMAYHPAAAAACLEELRDTVCFHPRTRSCAFVLSGLAPPGAPCTDSLDCNGVCSAPTPPCAGGGGSCSAFAARGADCTHDPCDPTTDFCQGPAETCAPLLPTGAKCIGRADCQFGLFCVGTYPDLTCQPPGVTGAPCTLTEEGCARGFYCDLMTMTCKAKVGAGGPCFTLSACLDGYTCAFEGVDATCAPILDVGDDCDPMIGIDLCPWAARCDDVARKCTAHPPHHAGDDCSTSRSCSWLFELEPLYCSGTTLTCVPMVPHGGGCNSSNAATEDPCYEGFCSNVTNTCLSCRR